LGRFDPGKVREVVKKFLRSVRRNPVINAFVAAALVQLLQDYKADAINWGHFSGYLATLCLGIVARGFTVPAKENEELKASVSEAIVDVNLRRFMK
jgi:hypothetical protein